MSSKSFLSFSLLCVALSGCLAMDDGGYSDGGYRDPYYGGGYRDPYYDDRYDWERERLRREREELERERRRLEDERRRRDDYYGQPRVPAQVAPRPSDTCPPGFRPGDHKCTDKERKRGCKDTRAPSGRLCVAGNY